MNHTDELIAALEENLGLCRKMLALVEEEHAALTQHGETSLFDFYQRRKELLPHLHAAVETLRGARLFWQGLLPRAREQAAAVGPLLQANQDLIMKVLVLDRENEQVLLRRGLVPANHLPAAQRQRPHYVANLYRRHHSA